MKRKTAGILVSSLILLALLVTACAPAPNEVVAPAPAVEKEAAPVAEPAPVEREATAPESAPVEKETAPKEELAPPEKAPPAEPPTPAKEPTPVQLVGIAGFAFAPVTVTVALGTTVTWSNRDAASHTVTSRGVLFDSGTLSTGATFSYTFRENGNLEYYCKIHPSMTARIIAGEGGVTFPEGGGIAGGGDGDYGY